MTDTLLNHVGGMLDLFIVLCVMTYIFRLGQDRRRTVGLLAATLAGFALVNGCAVWAGGCGLISGDTQFIVYVLCLLVFSWGYALLALEGNRKQILITMLFYICTLIVSCLLRHTLTGWIGLSAWVVNYILLILVALAFCAITRPITLPLPNRYWSVIGTIPLLTIGLMELLGQQEALHWKGVAAPLLFIVLLLGAYYLFMSLVVELERQMKLDLENQALAFQIRQMDSVDGLLEQVRTARHELKNNYFLLKSLLEQGRYEEMGDQLDEIIRTDLDRDDLVSTGNRLIDMILAQKKGEARRSSIPLRFDVLLPERLELQPQMLCSLLFNLLDNALEASVKAERPDVRCDIHMVKGYLWVEVRNRIDSSVLAENPGLLTSKPDKASHGIGLRLIRQIVRRCAGTLEVFEEDGYFIARAILPDS